MYVILLIIGLKYLMTASSSIFVLIWTTNPAQIVLALQHLVELLVVTSQVLLLFYHFHHLLRV